MRAQVLTVALALTASRPASAGSAAVVSGLGEAQAGAEAAARCRSSSSLFCYQVREAPPWSRDGARFVVSMQTPLSASDECAGDGSKCVAIEFALLIFDAASGQVVERVARACREDMSRQGGGARGSCREGVNDILGVLELVTPDPAAGAEIWKEPTWDRDALVFPPAVPGLEPLRLGSGELLKRGDKTRCLRAGVWRAHASMAPDGVHIATVVEYDGDFPPAPGCAFAGAGQFDPPIVKVSRRTPATGR